MPYGAEFTSETRRSVNLLPKYKCRDCSKFKETNSFSKKELNTYTWRVGTGQTLNAISAKLRCRPCAGGPLQEKFCEGQCGMWKDLQKFSKSSRANGGNQMCMDCTLWKESLEPGITVAPPPAGDFAPDEDPDNQAPSGDSGPSDYLSDPEAGGDDSDDEDYGYTSNSNTGASNVSYPTPHGSRQAPAASASAAGSRQAPSILLNTPAPRNLIQVPYEGLGNMSLGGTDDSKAGSSQTMSTGNIKNSALGSRIVPGPGSGSFYTMVNNGTPVSFPQIFTPNAGYARGPSESSARKNVSQANMDIKSVSSVSNPYEDVLCSAGGGWGPVDARRRAAPAPPVIYNAWDNKGQKHTQLRSPSSSGLTHSNSQSSNPISVNKPFSALTPGSAQAPRSPIPAPPTPAAQVQTARNSNWAKPVGDRGVRSTYNPVAVRAANAKNTRGRRPDGSELDADLQDM